MKQTTTTLPALLLCVAFAACKHEGGGVSEAGASFRPSARPPTQSSAISINNLDGEISDGERQSLKGEAFFRKRLPDLYLQRAAALGTSGDFDLADSESAANAARDPLDGEVRLSRAHVLGALHRFDEALAELDLSLVHNAQADDVKKARANIFLATGRCAEAAPIWPPMPYATDMAARGVLEQRLGHAALAETLFERGRLEFNDVSPIRFSWMDFERARSFEREGDTVKARAYLEDALDAFPEYAHAAVHLSAFEPGDKALAHLERVEKRADDPDVFAAHADTLRRLKRDAEADAMAQRAKARYEEVLAKHPEAYADHAARFFLGAGHDLPRALALAKSAASRAPSEETLELWLLTARASNAKDETCAAVAAVAKTTCPLAASRANFELAKKACNP